MKVTKEDLDGVKVQLDIPNELYRVGVMIKDTIKASDGSLRGFDYHFFRETEYIESGLVHIASRYRELALYHNRCSDLHNVVSVRIDMGTIHKLSGYKKYDGYDWYHELVTYVDSISVNDNNSISIEFTDTFTKDYVGYVLDAKALHDIVEDTVCDSDDDVIPFSDCREYTDWCQLLDTVVDCVNRLLSNAYRIYLDFMTSKDVADALVGRYGSGYVGSIKSRYHSYLGDSLFITSSVYVASGVIETLFVDPLMGYEIDGSDVSYCTIDDNYINMRDLHTKTDNDTIDRVLDILEMMAYINDGLIDYLDSQYRVINSTRISGTLYMPYRSDCFDICERFSSEVEKKYCGYFGKVTDGVSVCNVEDYFTEGWQFHFSIPVRLLSKKVMASRVSTSRVWFDTYVDLLRLYARVVFGITVLD